MLRRRFFIIAYIMTFLSSSLFVEGLPRPVEYLSEVGSHITKRIKRNAINFHRAIRCHQPEILILGTYGNYGCYCGFSGSGVAIDDTDKCCQRHDECYAEAGNVEKSAWESFVSLAGHIMQGYDSECREGEVICAKNSPYKSKLCQCDKEAALCMHKASATYHPQLIGIDTEKYCKVDASLQDLNLTTHFENRYDTKLPSTTTVVQAATTTQTADEEEYYQTKPMTEERKEEVIVPEIVKPVRVVRHHENSSASSEKDEVENEPKSLEVKTDEKKNANSASTQSEIKKPTESVPKTTRSSETKKATDEKEIYTSPLLNATLTTGPATESPDSVTSKTTKTKTTKEVKTNLDPEKMKDQKAQKTEKASKSFPKLAASYSGENVGKYHNNFHNSAWSVTGTFATSATVSCIFYTLHALTTALIAPLLVY